MLLFSKDGINHRPQIKKGRKPRMRTPLGLHLRVSRADDARFHAEQMVHALNSKAVLNSVYTPGERLTFGHRTTYP